MECKGTFSRAKDDGCFVRGSVGVDEAMLRGVRERSQDAVQALGFVEALDGETGTGKGTISGSQEVCEDSVWVQAWRRWQPDSGPGDSI